MARGFRDEDNASSSTEKFLDVKALRQTEKALLCEIDGAEHWVPQSQIHEDSEVYEAGNEGTLVVTHWWADKNGLV